jgi:hypothetical protein
MKAKIEKCTVVSSSNCWLVEEENGKKDVG